MLKFVERVNVLGKAWDDVVENSDDGWVYALFDWQQVILSVKEWGLQDASFAVEVDGELAAVIPLQFHPAGRSLGISAWGGCGPIIRNSILGHLRSEISAAIFARCREVAVEWDAVTLEFSQSAVTAACLSNTYGVNHAIFHGFEDRSGLTQVIDISQSHDRLWNNVSKNARNIIRRAERAGLRVEQVEWAEHVSEYYGLHCETYRRTGVTPHPLRYFSGIAESMAPRGYAVLSAAFDAKGRVLAYHNDASFGPGRLYHTGCSADSAQESGANYLLLWNSIIGAKRAGKIAYEVGPIFPGSLDAKQRGLTFFKTRFGGAPRRALRSSLSYSKVKDNESQPTVTDEVSVGILRAIARVARKVKRPL